MAAVRVKICGITCEKDALAAVRAGADALGFVFYEKSSRAVAPDQVAAIVKSLPPFVTTVGLFVNAETELISRIMTQTGLQVVQLHGDETPAQCRLLDWPVIKALRIRDAGSLQQVHTYPVAAVLLDAWSQESYGGTGQQFDWQLVQDLGCDRPVILAGGLNPDNVAGAVHKVRPYAVDVSSGVESSPGRKDAKLIADFIRQVRNA